MHTYIHDGAYMYNFSLSHLQRRVLLRKHSVGCFGTVVIGCCATIGQFFPFMFMCISYELYALKRLNYCKHRALTYRRDQHRNNKPSE